MSGVWASWLGLALTMLGVFAVAANRSVPFVIGILITAVLCNAYGLLCASIERDRQEEIWRKETRWIAELWNKSKD